MKNSVYLLVYLRNFCIYESFVASFIFLILFEGGKIQGLSLRRPLLRRWPKMSIFTPFCQRVPLPPKNTKFWTFLDFFVKIHSIHKKIFLLSMFCVNVGVNVVNFLWFLGFDKKFIFHTLEVYFNFIILIKPQKIFHKYQKIL